MNSQNKQRVRVARGIYKDQWGFAVCVSVSRRRQEKRFPADTAMDVMQAWQSRVRADFQDDRLFSPEGARPDRGTLAADMPRFLLRIRHRVAFKSDHSHLKAWLPKLGGVNRGQISADQVQSVVDGWRDAGASPRTIRHRVRVLRELYQTLDGKYARPPLVGLIRPKPADPHPTAVSDAIIRKVAKSLQKGKRHKRGYGSDAEKTAARFLVLALSGQRPAQLMKAEPGDVAFARRIWFVRAAKGGLQVPLPMSPQLLKAFRLFAKADAWGKYDSRSFAKTVRRHGWPVGVRPYTLRHTVAIDMLNRGADLGDVQGILGHRQIETTRRHYAPVLLSRLRKVITSRRLKIA